MALNLKLRQRPPAPAVSNNDFAAQRSLRTALELLESGETDRALVALRNLLNQFPDSSIKYKANLERSQRPGARSSL